MVIVTFNRIILIGWRNWVWHQMTVDFLDPLSDQNSIFCLLYTVCEQPSKQWSLHSTGRCSLFDRYGSFQTLSSTQWIAFLQAREARHHFSVHCLPLEDSLVTNTSYSKWDILYYYFLLANHHCWNILIFGECSDRILHAVDKWRINGIKHLPLLPVNC